MKPRKQLNRVTRALLSVGFLGGLHLMLVQAGVPVGGGIPGAPITPVPGATGGGAPIPGVTGSGGALPGMAVTPQPGGGGVVLPTGLPGGTGTIRPPSILPPAFPYLEPGAATPSRELLFPARVALHPEQLLHRFRAGCPQINFPNLPMPKSLPRPCVCFGPRQN